MKSVFWWIQMQMLLSQVKNCQKFIQRLILPVAIALMAFSLFVTPVWATGVYEIPNLTPDTWIVDEGDVISRFNEGKINGELAELAKQTGNEVRFITVHRLDYGETAESFTKALLEKWFPDKEAQANQTILMVDTVSNKIAILTGSSVKPIMSDEVARSVAFETFATPLRDGDKYNQAFVDASDRLIAVLSGQPDPGPPQITENVQVEGTFTKAEDTEKEKSNSIAWVVGLLIAATVIPMATYYLYLVVQPNSNG
jgi:uncharacterized protein